MKLGCENEINEILQSWIRKKESKIRDSQLEQENLPNVSVSYQTRTKGVPKKRVRRCYYQES